MPTRIEVHHSCGLLDESGLEFEFWRRRNSPWQIDDWAGVKFVGEGQHLGATRHSNHNDMRQ